jgi:uncharacterized protein (DUF2235 family)
VGKNILIFSDGTGQRGGLQFDEPRSNIYKLYRATRCGPDSSVDPSEQLTFYDPGLGTLPGGLGLIGMVWRKLYNLVSQATGLGITANIIDCYAAIISLWQPGDRIFLFGFSRGAYTIRCVGGVLALCGVPTRMKGGEPLKRDPVSARRIASEAVKRVYQHVSSPKDAPHFAQRVALAAQFRANYGADHNGRSNAFPYFVGVFDTVASLGSYRLFAALAACAVLLVVGASFVLSYLSWSFPFWLMVLGAGGVAAAIVAYVATHLKFARGLPGFTFWQTLHFAAPTFRFYDQTLNPNVAYARHALSINEERAHFDRVPWGNPQDSHDTKPPWLEQVWFAGNHSDVGGSYPENEARLSDIALEWMTNEARNLPDGLVIDDAVLQLYPSPAGMQHDETRTSIFRYARRIIRSVPPDAPLHPSVFERFDLPAVLHYDVMAPYRPEGLRNHDGCRQYYEPISMRL